MVDNRVYLAVPLAPVELSLVAAAVRIGHLAPALPAVSLPFSYIQSITLLTIALHRHFHRPGTCVAAAVIHARAAVSLQTSAFEISSMIPTAP